eukprot:GHVN01061413.1.p1 GENE.GHVN01061413.1~~GHVN01061413.1.p1  ORF type:complete len:264 (+),score=39.43 GHVN01061413.1:111-794(+)
MAISAICFGEHYPSSLLPSVLMVIIGVGCTVWGDIEFHLLGMVLILLGCLFSSLKGILTQKTQVGKLGLGTLDVLRITCPLAAAQLLTLSYLLGEIEKLAAGPPLPSVMYFHLTLLGLVAFGLNFTSFRVAALMNPLTLNIAGNVKQVLTSLLSIAIFGGVLSLALTIGIFVTAVGAYLYATQMKKWRESEKAKIPKSPKGAPQTSDDLELTPHQHNKERVISGLNS